MSINMIAVQIPCEFCGKLHEEHAIDGHICVPHLCEDCWRSVIREWECKRSQCLTCSHCRLHEDFGVYICYYEDGGRSIPDTIFINECACPDREVKKYMEE